jgi:hypothetical protein
VRQKTNLDPLRGHLGGLDQVVAERLVFLFLLLRRRGSSSPRGLCMDPPNLDGWDFLGPHHLDGQDLLGFDFHLCRPFVSGWILHLHILERGRDPVAGLLFLLLPLFLAAGAALCQAHPWRGQHHDITRAALGGRPLCLPLGAAE